MDKIVEKFSKMEGLLSGTGVPDSLINEAEEKLGLHFSAEYKQYLSSFGVAAVNGHELTGLGSSSRVNVVDVTMSQRSRCNVDDSLYVIEESNIDKAVYWQNKSGTIFLTVRDSEPKQVANSLIAFVKE